MMTTYDYQGRLFYLLIDKDTVALKMIPIAHTDDMFRVTLRRKVIGHSFGQTLRDVPDDYQTCYVMASTLIAFTNEGVPEAKKEFVYDVKVNGGVLNYLNTPATKLLDAVEFK